MESKVIAYLSNYEQYHQIALKHYQFYSQYNQLVEIHGNRIRGLTANDISLGADGKYIVPDKKQHDFDLYNESSLLRNEEAYIAVLFEAFTIEAYINNAAVALFGDEVIKNIKSTDTVAKFKKLYYLMTHRGIQKKSAVLSKLVRLFDFRNNLVHSTCVPIYDASQIQAAIPHLYGDGKNPLFDDMDAIMDTFELCRLVLSEAEDEMIARQEEGE